VNFEGGTPGRTVVSDHAFVQMGDKSLLVIASSVDNKVVVADLDDGSTKEMQLTAADEASGENGRSIEWAVGTKHVWISGSTASQQYILNLKDMDVANVELERTIADWPASQLIYVENYEFAAQENQLSGLRSGAGSGDKDNNDDEAELAMVLAIVAMAVAALSVLMMLYVLSQKNKDEAPSGARSVGSKRVT